eukprot:GDKI01024608.1.p1 GENE.GDKI01024608.1~~GDKI01024608.1.p1  ORF type:complete len:173 (+),score=66.78 GDKI01024608.1:27-521(+)
MARGLGWVSGDIRVHHAEVTKAVNKFAFEELAVEITLLRVRFPNSATDSSCGGEGTPTGAQCACVWTLCVEGKKKALLEALPRWVCMPSPTLEDTRLPQASQHTTHATPVNMLILTPQQSATHTHHTDSTTTQLTLRGYVLGGYPTLLCAMMGLPTDTHTPTAP